MIDRPYRSETAPYRSTSVRKTGNARRCGMKTLRWLITLLFCAIAADATAMPQVTGQITVAAAKGSARHNHDVGVVLWLPPLAGRSAPRLGVQNGALHARLI